MAMQYKVAIALALMLLVSLAATPTADGEIPTAAEFAAGNDEAGPGGNVRITADSSLTTGSVVSASSTLGIPDTINIQTVTTNVSGTVVALTATPLQATALLREPCATRFSGVGASSLVVGTREGVSGEPDRLWPSPALTEPLMLQGRSSGDGWLGVSGRWLSLGFIPLRMDGGCRSAGPQ